MPTVGEWKKLQEIQPKPEPDPATDWLLRLTLETTVPIKIAELRNMPQHKLDAMREEALDSIASSGDVILYRRPGTAEAMGQLIRALAICAFAPGGIEFAGHHWEAA